jgi:hypothetical protein
VRVWVLVKELVWGSVLVRVWVLVKELASVWAWGSVWGSVWG